MGIQDAKIPNKIEADSDGFCIKYRVKRAKYHHYYTGIIKFQIDVFPWSFQDLLDALSFLSNSW